MLTTLSLIALFVSAVNAGKRGLAWPYCALNYWTIDIMPDIFFARWQTTALCTVYNTFFSTCLNLYHHFPQGSRKVQHREWEGEFVTMIFCRRPNPSNYLHTGCRNVRQTFLYAFIDPHLEHSYDWETYAPPSTNGNGGLGFVGMQRCLDCDSSPISQLASRHAAQGWASTSFNCLNRRLRSHPSNTSRIHPE